MLYAIIFNCKKMPKSYTDQIGHTFGVSGVPKRIVSLVPSQTELLYDLGLDEEVVGITKFCIHPKQWFRTKTRVGGTKDFKLDHIKVLAPDLIIANKEENEIIKIKALQTQYRVYTSDIATLNDAYGMINAVGELVGKSEKATTLVSKLKKTFAELPKRSDIKVAYLIWQKPYMVAAKATFIDDMLSNVCGFDNVFGDLMRYPCITLKDLQDKKPDVLFLSSEPYPFKEKHIYELSKLLPHTTCKLVDGELFSWYGSRLLQSANYFKQIL